MDRHGRNPLILVSLILLAMFAITIVALSGIRTTKDATDTAARNLTALRASAARNECARQINADVEQIRWDAVSALVSANADARQAARERLAHLPNTADLVNKKCPPPIARP